MILRLKNKSDLTGECENYRRKWRKVLDAGDPYSNINFDKSNAQYTVRTDKIK